MENAWRERCPAVSVITVNFNGGHLVTAAVDAVLASEVPVEVIVADNGSTVVLWHLHKGMIRFYRKFFRRQYPTLVMWAVALAVWARFAVLAMGVLAGATRLRQTYFPFTGTGSVGASNASIATWR